MNLQSDIKEIKGIGDKSAEAFRRINLNTVNDLLHYYPRTYEKFEQIISIKDIDYYSRNVVLARIIDNPKLIRTSRMPMIVFHIADASEGVLQIKFFNASYLLKTIKKDSVYVFRGYVKQTNTGNVMYWPKMYKPEDYRKIENTIGPIYTQTKDLTQTKLEKAVRESLKSVKLMYDYIPNDLLSPNNLYSISDAIQSIHFPKDENDLSLARRRLVLDEFIQFIDSVSKANDGTIKPSNNFPMIETAEIKLLSEKLPYELTGSQKEAIRDCINDMTSDLAMNRLIQGDVGSGKTMIAVFSLLLCASNGYQGALMAPTEVLANQHFDNIKEMSERYKLCLKPVLLTGKMSAKDRRLALAEIETGEANVVIGTHALFTENVVFNKLALVITDEQHRFGVNQREKLRDKGLDPHLLVMSATPIPRTLAMIMFGNLDISVMKDMPKNRIPIMNCVVSSKYSQKAYDLITSEIKKGHQAYVICPMVDESENDNINLKNVTDYANELREVFGPSINIATLHGKMKATEKAKVMLSFKDRQIDILVSTTVIEVGIDVPNATVMMIVNADRFGLSQLHQIRGRVGRGDSQSYCILVSDSPNPDTQKRLKIMNETNDGFKIANEDMKMRGPGELNGVRQSGEFSFAIGDVINDSDIMMLANNLYPRIKKYIPSSQSNLIDFRTI